MKIELTDKQAQTLVALLDIAVKAAGLQAAAAALEIVQAVEQAQKSEG